MLGARQVGSLGRFVVGYAGDGQGCPHEGADHRMFGRVGCQIQRKMAIEKARLRGRFGDSGVEGFGERLIRSSRTYWRSGRRDLGNCGGPRTGIGLHEAGRLVFL